jgi:hypothetical protein
MQTRVWKRVRIGRGAGPVGSHALTVGTGGHLRILRLTAAHYSDRWPHPAGGTSWPALDHTYAPTMQALPSVAAAETLARELLEPLGNRWLHTQAVAARAHELIPAVTPPEDRPLLVVAAWWHDLGYAPALRETGCHQIDGARYLARARYPQRLVALVAHHSAATCEATQRGLLPHLDVWPREQSAAADALWTADMTTGPRGEAMTYDERLTEILIRYEPTSVVGQAMQQAEPAIRAAIQRTQQRMTATDSSS